MKRSEATAIAAAVRVALVLVMVVVMARVSEGRNLTAMGEAEDAVGQLAERVAAVYAHSKCALVANCSCSYSASLSALPTTATTMCHPTLSDVRFVSFTTNKQSGRCAMCV